MYLVRKKGLFDSLSKEPYRLSRTRIDNFHKCRRCFWLEERFGIKKPASYPLTLNIAVDALLKKEFDAHRIQASAHPLMKTYGIDAVPFAHADMEKWRHNFTGVVYVHAPTNLHIFGAVDDIWKNKNGELIVVDYKATAKASTPTLDGDLGAQYKRQMEVYQWLLRQNGFKVSSTGYFVYVNGKKDAAAFDGKLEFDVMLLPCEGDDAWLEPTLLEIKETLISDVFPETGNACEYCPYREAAGRKLLEIRDQFSAKPKTKPKSAAKASEKYEEKTKSLF
ncbi:MAG: PD-(D/E)XK nuclease family protein [Minisyncoccia bacterium]